MVTDMQTIITVTLAVPLLTMVLWAVVLTLKKVFWFLYQIKQIV